MASMTHRMTFRLTPEQVREDYYNSPKGTFDRVLRHAKSIQRVVRNHHPGAQFYLDGQPVDSIVGTIAEK